MHTGECFRISMTSGNFWIRLLFAYCMLRLGQISTYRWYRRRFGIQPDSKGSALTSPWLKKKHIVVITPPSRLPLNRTNGKRRRGREQTTDSERSASIWCFKSIFDRREITKLFSDGWLLKDEMNHEKFIFLSWMGRSGVTWGRHRRWRTGSSSRRSAGTRRWRRNTPGRPNLTSTTTTQQTDREDGYSDGQQIQQKTLQSDGLVVLSYTVIIMVLVLIQFKFKSGTFVSWNDPHTPTPNKEACLSAGEVYKDLQNACGIFENTLALTWF